MEKIVTCLYDIACNCVKHFVRVFEPPVSV